MSITDDERRQAEWRLLNAQIRQTERQARWEVPKALAMVLLAAAAIAAAGRLTDWLYPPTAQSITVHLEGPLQVQLLGAKP